MTTAQARGTELDPGDFPTGFQFGVATAAHQIEGAVDEGGRSPSIWETFAHTPGKTRNGEHADVTVDHYHRFREDVDLMADLGVDTYRFSIAWSRLLAPGMEDLNSEGVAFYRELCQLLLDNGITPTATLYHWDLPQELQDRGGWVNPASIDWFRTYAVLAKEALGDLIKTWATFNEPWCTAFLGYSSGEHAPGIKDAPTSFVAAHHLMIAHHEAVEAMQTTNPHDDDRLGIVLNLIPAWPASDSPEDLRAAQGVDDVHNGLFAGAVLFGEYPDGILEIHERMGVADQIDLDRLAAVRTSIDFLGVNYYNINHIEYVEGAAPMPAWPGAENARVTRPPGELTDMGWGVEPEGITWMLKRIHDWAPGLPLMITENGAAYPDVVAADGAVHDPKRTDYIQRHIAAVHDAIEAGVNVVAYYVWSLLDNYEWAKGYSMRFGIVRVDYETQTRTVKDSGIWYRDWLSRRDS